MVGAVRFEPLAIHPEFANKSEDSAMPGQVHTHGDTQNPGKTSPELTRLVKVWEQLPGHIQKTILTLVDAHEPPAVVPFERPDRRVA
jgi:hypothetical protein